MKLRRSNPGPDHVALAVDERKRLIKKTRRRLPSKRLARREAIEIDEEVREALAKDIEWPVISTPELVAVFRAAMELSKKKGSKCQKSNGSQQDTR